MKIESCYQFHFVNPSRLGRGVFSRQKNIPSGTFGAWLQIFTKVHFGRWIEQQNKVLYPPMLLANIVSRHLIGCDLRPFQVNVLRNSIFQGQSAYCVFPTGMGKSLIYQASSKMLEGITLVVSPLKALMDDQIHNMPHAATIHGNVTPLQRQAIMTAVQEETVKLLYVAPEQLLMNPRLLRLLQKRYNMVVIDEADLYLSCGSSFRSDYLNIVPIIKEIVRPKVILMMTATIVKSEAIRMMATFNIPIENYFTTDHYTYKTNLSCMTYNLGSEPLLGKFGGNHSTTIQSWRLVGGSASQVNKVDHLIQHTTRGLVFCKTRAETEILFKL